MYVFIIATVVVMDPTIGRCEIVCDVAVLDLPLGVLSKRLLDDNTFRLDRPIYCKVMEYRLHCGLTLCRSVSVCVCVHIVLGIVLRLTWLPSIYYYCVHKVMRVV